MNLQPVTDDLLTAFCADQLARWEEHRKRMGFESEIHDRKFYAEKGPKYARIVAEHTDGHSKYVVCFVDLATGNIHKADGRKHPNTRGKTCGVRGNLAKAWKNGFATGYEKASTIAVKRLSEIIKDPGLLERVRKEFE